MKITVITDCTQRMQEKSHPGKSAEEAGFPAKTVDLPEKGPTLCVLMRKAPEGEYDLDLEASLDSLIRETEGAETLQLREGGAERNGSECSSNHPTSQHCRE